MSTKLISKVNRWLNIVQRYLLPGTCIHCNKLSDRFYDLCKPCEIEFPRVKDPCESCGLPLPANNYDGHICGACIIMPPPFKHIVAAFDYAQPIDRLIKAFKYQSKLAFGKVLTHQLLLNVQTFYQKRDLPELLIPMPLHTKRLRQRGFNQSIEICRHLSRHLQIPYNYNLCYRNRSTPQQEGLNEKARKQNIRGAFSAYCQDLPKSVAIIDDVVTTTASARELSKLLKRNGVDEVHIWSLARACERT
jgi:ComF family protein